MTLDAWANPDVHVVNNYLSERNVDAYYKIFTDAENQVKNTEYHKRTQKEKLSVSYADLLLSKGTADISYNNRKIDMQKVNKFVSDAAECGITMLSAGTVSPKDFRDKILNNK